MLRSAWVGMFSEKIRWLALLALFYVMGIGVWMDEVQQAGFRERLEGVFREKDRPVILFQEPGRAMAPDNVPGRLTLAYMGNSSPFLPEVS